MHVQLIHIDSISEDPGQPRRHIDSETIQGLAASLRQHGILNPITVRRTGEDGQYRIITGERRWRAARIAGIEEMPCIIKELDPDALLTEQLVENLQREDLQPAEKAQALMALKDQLGATNRELATRLGMSERTVGHLIDLLDLPFDIADQVVATPNRPADGQLTEKHARHLRQLNDQPDLQDRVVQRVRNDHLTGEATGRLVKALRTLPDNAAEIMAAPVRDLEGYLKASERLDRAPATAVPQQMTHQAQAVSAFAESLDNIRPMELSRPEVRELQDALSALRMAVDALLRECKLELDE